jgi:hypothetical protein
VAGGANFLVDLETTAETRTVSNLAQGQFQGPGDLRLVIVGLVPLLVLPGIISRMQPV